jgi:hypothetical protein
VPCLMGRMPLSFSLKFLPSFTCRASPAKLHLPSSNLTFSVGLQEVEGAAHAAPEKSLAA